MASSFNIDRFMDGSSQLDLSDIDWTAVPKPSAHARSAAHDPLLSPHRELHVLLHQGAAAERTCSTREPEFAPSSARGCTKKSSTAGPSASFLEAYGEPVPQTTGKLLQDPRPGERIDEIGQSIALAHMFPEAWPARAHDLGHGPGDHDVLRVPVPDRPDQAPGARRDLPADHEAGAPALRVLPRARQAPPRGLAAHAEGRLARAHARLDARRRGHVAPPRSRSTLVQLSLRRDRRHRHRPVEQQMRELPGLESFDLFTCTRPTAACGRARRSGSSGAGAVVIDGRRRRGCRELIASAGLLRHGLVGGGFRPHVGHDGRLIVVVACVGRVRRHGRLRLRMRTPEEVDPRREQAEACPLRRRETAVARVAAEQIASRLREESRAGSAPARTRRT